MIRPKTLPLKKLKQHIQCLRKENNLRIKWISVNAAARYDPSENILHIPRIESIKNYLTCLHEIGHCLDKNIQTAAAKYHKLVKKSKRLGNETDCIVSNVEKLNVNSAKFTLIKIKSQFRNVSRCVKRLEKKITSKEWVWNNEMNAWKYAYKNALVWNKKCEEHSRLSMFSYWMFSEDIPLKTTEDEKAISFANFKKKYEDPIFEYLTSLPM
jgi:hypothetical protein